MWSKTIAEVPGSVFAQIKFKAGFGFGSGIIQGFTQHYFDASVRPSSFLCYNWVKWLVERGRQMPESNLFLSQWVYSANAMEMVGRRCLVCTVFLPRPMSDVFLSPSDKLVGRGRLYDMVFLFVRGRTNKFFLDTGHRTAGTRTRMADPPLDRPISHQSIGRGNRQKR
jgi:hypothetical protein